MLPGEGAGGGVGTTRVGCQRQQAVRSGEDGAGLGTKHRPQASGADGQCGGCPETHGPELVSASGRSSGRAAPLKTGGGATR